MVKKRRRKRKRRARERTERHGDVRRRELMKHRCKLGDTELENYLRRWIKVRVEDCSCAGPRIPSLILADLEHLFLLSFG